MPKTIESRLVIKSEFQDQAAPKLSKLEQQLDRVISKTDQAERGGGRGFFRPRDDRGRFAPMGGAGGYGGGGATGGYGGGSPRSPHAPPSGERERDERGRRVRPISDIEMDRGRDKDKKRNWFQRTSSGAGWLMGGAGGLMGAATGQMLPAVGGMLSATGGQLNAAFGGLGAIAGLPLMYAGGMMQLASIASGPARAHYDALAPSYRVLGNERAERAKWAAAGGVGNPGGTWTQEEAIQISRQLSKVGGYNAFETMTKMRYGGYEQEFMQPFMEQATKAGAAGQRTPEDYDRLGKIIATAFNKGEKLASIEQAINTVSGLMSLSESHLADLSDTDTKELTALSKWGEASGTALLKGQRGVQTMGNIWNWVANPGDRGSQMYMWSVLAQKNPGMGYMEMKRMSANPASIMPVLKDLAAQGDFGSLILSKRLGGSVPQADAVLKAVREGKSYDEVKKQMDKANNTDINFKASTAMFDAATALKASISAQTLAMSSKALLPAMEMEAKLVEVAANVFTKMKMPEQMEHLTKAIEKLGDYIEGKSSIRKDAAQGVTTGEGTAGHLAAGIPILAIGQIVHTILYGGKDQPSTEKKPR